MFNHEIFAVSLARSLELARTGAPADQQKSALRAVYALTSVASAMVRVYQEMLTVDDVGIPDSLPSVTGLIQRVRDHGVAEIAIAKGAAPVELLALIMGLAAEPPAEGGAQRLKLQLRDARSTAIMVIPVQPDEGDPGHRALGVTEAFDALEIAAARAAAEPVPATPAAEDFELPAELPTAMPNIELFFDEPPDLWPASQAPAEPAPAETVSPPAPKPAEALAPQILSAETPLGAALAQVARDPYGPGILDRLTDLSQQIQEALAEDEVQAALHAIVAAIAWEPTAPEGSPRNSYAIVLRRTLTRELLTQVARYVADPRLGPEAIRVMQRGHADAADLLVGLLAMAEGIKERKVYMTALRGMPKGLAQVVHALRHSQWFVVRNVADLMGDLRIEEAVPELGRCLGHGDARVRRAAAVALAKIGTNATVEPLRRVLKEGDRELRALIAGSIGGPKSRALAMPLVAFAEQEQDPEVLRELYCALGRIGTSEAVQALAKAAQPGGFLLSRRPSGTRVAAVEGLQLAGGQLAVGALRGLVEDGDKSVRELARTALKNITMRARS